MATPMPPSWILVQEWYYLSTHRYLKRYNYCASIFSITHHWMRYSATSFCKISLIITPRHSEKYSVSHLLVQMYCERSISANADGPRDAA